MHPESTGIGFGFAQRTHHHATRDRSEGCSVELVFRLFAVSISALRLLQVRPGLDICLPPFLRTSKLNASRTALL